jgi:hypothetical protein
MTDEHAQANNGAPRNAATPTMTTTKNVTIAATTQR